MKKSVFVFLILAFILAACGGETPPPPPEPTEVVEVAPEPTEVPAPDYSISLDLAFDDVEDFNWLDKHIEADDPSQVPDENFMKDEALRIGGGNLLREANLRPSFSAGSFAHLRVRLSADACHHIDLGINNDRQTDYWEAIRIDGCTYNPYNLYALQENQNEHMEGRLLVNGSALITPDEWADIVFWLHADGDKVFSLMGVDGNISYNAVQLPEDWQNGKAFIGFGGWLDPESQSMDVDFVRVGDGSFTDYLAENVPAYLQNQPDIDAFLDSEAEAFPELITINQDGNGDGGQNPDSIVAEWLNDPEVVFSENVEAMAQNDGGQFGPGATKEFVAEGGLFAFSDDDGGIWTPLNTHLDQYGGMETQGNQAFLIHFQPLPPFSLGFVFMGDNELWVDFWEGGKPSIVWVAETNKGPFEGNLALEEGGWYYALMAMDRDGNFRSVVWEDGNPENKAWISDALGEREQGDGYKNQSWKFIISSNAPMTLNVADYQVMKFSGFAQ